MKTSAALVAALVTGVLGVGSCGRDVRAELTSDSEFTFIGTVVLPRSATIDAEDVSRLAIVRVDDILYSVPLYRDLKGGQITVQLREPDRVKEGEQRVFYTRGWHLGDGIGVVELDSKPAPPASQVQTLRSDVERSRQQQTEAQLAERVRTAELIVSGRVTAVRPSTIPRGASEHDPDWQEADIQVANVIRGTASGGTVTILFPGTDDVAWVGWPKYREGMEGIWLLRSYSMGRERLPRVVTMQAADFRPRSEEALVRRLAR
jgi:hypothetical protein